MAKENDTIAEIIAEMRGDANADEYTPDGILGQKLNYIADRLEAAYKRERGDCAKLREALLSMKKSIDDMGAASLDGDPEIMLMSLTQVCARLSARIDAALAAPPRNCDVGTVKEQFARFRKFCKKDSMDSLAATAYCAYECPCGNNYDCKLAWAQMPYEEGGAK